MHRWMLVVLALAVIAAAPPRPSVLRPRGALVGHSWKVSCLAFRPDGKLLASGSLGSDRNVSARRGEVRLWDLTSNECEEIWKGHQDEPTALAFSPDGNKVVSVTSSLERIHWDTKAGKAERTLQASPRRAEVRSLVFGRDGKQIGACGSSSWLIWDAGSGKELHRHERKIDSGGSILGHSLRLLAAPNHQDVDLWDVSTGKRVRSLLDHCGRVGSLSFSRDDRRLAVSCTRRTDDDRDISAVWLWDVGRGQRERVIPLGNLGPSSMALSADGALLAVAGSLDGRDSAELRLFATATGSELARLRPDGVQEVRHLAFGPDAKMLAAACDREVRLWFVVAPRAAGRPGSPGR